MKACVVTKVLVANPRGGAIFNIEAEGALHRVVAPITVMPRPPVKGESWWISGIVRRHQEHGTQVYARKAVLMQPAGKVILSFLQGQSCPGIGEKTALKLWNALGMRIYEALTDPADTRIEAIIGTDLARIARTAWRENAHETAAYQWCDQNGLPMRLARCLSTIYGANLAEKMRENPYRLIAFTSWANAESVAATLGLPDDDPRRLIAAVDNVIFRRLDDGHTAVHHADLEKLVATRLNLSRQTAHAAVCLAQAHGALREKDDLLLGAGAAVMERFVARRLLEADVGRGDQMTWASSIPENELESVIDAFDKEGKHRLSPSQRKAVLMAMVNGVSMLTGGAGTGKTTALKALYHVADTFAVPVVQAALAGRAARRMEEATARPATTIMGLLARIRDGLTLDDTLVVIDEASMIDLPTMYRLLRHAAESTRFLFVGDPAQLPPIGFGLVLHAMTKTTRIPRVELTQVHRQSEDTGIPAASSAVRSGITPELEKFHGEASGVCFIDCGSKDILDTALHLSSTLAGAQIISPLRNGPTGTKTINAAFSAIHGAGCPSIAGFSLGEPVIWTVNDYDLQLMNGSLGKVVNIRDDGMLVDFEGTCMTITELDFSHLEHAYAITVHKSQGSQFERVIVPFESSAIGDRAMIYTAITRARLQVVILGDRGAFEAAIQAPPNDQRRVCGIGKWLNAPS